MWAKRRRPRYKVWCLVLMPTPQGHLQEASATTRMISIPIIWSLLHMLPQREALAPTNKIATIIIGVLLLVPPPQWHPHEAQATCKISYVIGATSKDIILGNAPIPYAKNAMAKATSHGSATSIKTRWSRKRNAPPPRPPLYPSSSNSFHSTKEFSIIIDRKSVV